MNKDIEDQFENSSKKLKKDETDEEIGVNNFWDDYLRLNLKTPKPQQQETNDKKKTIKHVAFQL